MHGAVLDTAVLTETPEGIMLELHPAGLSARCYAFVLDWIIRIVVISIAAYVAQFMQGFGNASILILAFFLEWLYPVVFELTASGASPGKRALGLKVVMDNGLPVTHAASLTRNLLRFVDFFPWLYGFAVASMLMRHDFKRLGDIAAATLVVYAPRPAQKFALPQVEIVQPTSLLSPRDQAAVIGLAARSTKLTQERVDELAFLAARVSGDAGQTGPTVTRRVLGVAQWLLGHR